MRLGYYHCSANLFPDIPYLVYDEDAKGLEDTLSVSGIETEIWQPSKWYKGEDLNNKSLLYFSLGTYRKGLFDIQVIRFLEQKYPLAEIDIVTHIDIFILFQQFGYGGGWNKYPMPLEFAEKYDYVLSNELMIGHSLIPGKSLIEAYKSKMPKDFELQSLELSMSPAIEKVTRLEKRSKLAISPCS